MKTLATTVAALLFAGAAHAQTPALQPPPPVPASALTIDLNSGPPAPAVYLAPAPTSVTVDATVGVAPVAPRPTPPVETVAPSPRPIAPRAVSAGSVLPPSAPPASAPPTVVLARPIPTPATPPPAPRAVPISPANAMPSPRAEPVAAPLAAPSLPAEPGPSVAPAAPAAPAVTVLDADARAALPFTADLPPGFEIVTGRPGPDFRIYTIRRDAQSFVMVYAGPASQFPIYSGQMVEAGGRASILSTENGVRHAVEHLFQRAATPREIHIWTMSMDGADRAMAEAIAQSVDVR